VWGEDDQIAPAALLARWPGEHVTVPGAGHLAEWDSPAPVAAALEAFLGD
jgi:pimeloyl-ACP methyl ester carboxylesterase